MPKIEIEQLNETNKEIYNQINKKHKTCKKTYIDIYLIKRNKKQRKIQKLITKIQKIENRNRKPFNYR